MPVPNIGTGIAIDISAYFQEVNQVSPAGHLFNSERVCAC
jgi:hypothetical protein